MSNNTDRSLNLIYCNQDSEMSNNNDISLNLMYCNQDSEMSNNNDISLNLMYCNQGSEMSNNKDRKQVPNLAVTRTMGIQKYLDSSKVKKWQHML